MQGLVRNYLIAGAGISCSGCLVRIHQGTMSPETGSRQVVQCGAAGAHANVSKAERLGHVHTPAVASFIDRNRNQSSFLLQSNMIRRQPVLKSPRWIGHLLQNPYLVQCVARMFPMN